MTRASGFRGLSRRGLLLASTGLGAGLMLGLLPLPAAAQGEAGFDASCGSPPG
jgi:hypothetical protein